MKTVYFVRHGESVGNATRTYQSTETPLTEKGLEQAVYVAKRCSLLTFDTLIASGMLRAQQTAREISAMTGKPVETCEHFGERRRPSEVVGKAIGDPAIEYIEHVWARSLEEEQARVGDGETFAEVKARAKKALDFLEAHQSEKLLVVTHGFFLRTILAYIIFGEELTGRELARVIQAFWSNNTAITVITDDSHSPISRWRIRVFGDQAHLD